MNSRSKQILQRSLIFCLVFFPSTAFSQQTYPPNPEWTRPRVERKLYRGTVDGKFLWKKYHLSGLLLIKTMPDSSIRTVFSNEMGFPFFDFSWDTLGSFTKHSMLEKMDRKPIVNLLREDFETVFEMSKRYSGHGAALSVPGKRSRLFRIMYNSAGRNLVLRALINLAEEKEVGRYVPYIERLGYQPRINLMFNKITLLMEHNDGELPKEATIINHRANFTIKLKEILSDYAE